MAIPLAKAQLPSDAAARVMLAVDTAVEVMLEEPGVNRAVMSWIGTGGGASGQAWARSTALRTLALGAGEGFPDHCREKALGFTARAVASTPLLGFTERSKSAS